MCFDEVVMPTIKSHKLFVRRFYKLRFYRPSNTTAFLAAFIVAVIAFVWLPGLTTPTKANQRHRHHDKAASNVKTGDFFSVARGADTAKGVDLAQPLRVRWQIETNEISDLSPTVEAEVFYVPLAPNSIIAIEAASGNALWRTDLGGEMSASPIADKRAVYVASRTSVEKKDGNQSSSLRAFSAKTGLALWTKAIDERAVAVFEFPDSVAVVGTRGTITAHDKTTGNVLRSNKLNTNGVRGAITAKDKIYILTDKQIYAVSTVTSETSLLYQTLVDVKSVAVGERHLFVATNDNRVAAIELSSKRSVWSFGLKADIQFLTAANNRLVVATADGFVYGHELERGARAWKRRLEGRVTARPVAFGDDVILSPRASEFCVILNTTNGRVQNLLPVGDDGNVVASPAISRNILLITTRRRLKAFGN